MMARLLCLLLACLSFTGMINAEADPTIKVLILHDKESADVEVKGKYKIFDPHTNSQLINLRLVGKNKPVEALAGGLKWGEEFPGVFQINIIPQGNDTQILVNGVLYPGSLQIYDVGGKVSIVNELPLEDYLRFLLADRFDQNLADEALAALVIAARTNAYYFAKNPKTRFWSVDGSKEGYRGYVNANPTNPIQRALKNTRNMVMSKTGLYEGVITPFALHWNKGGSNDAKAQASLISVVEVEELANKGVHAAAILDKAYPKTTIQMIK